MTDTAFAIADPDDSIVEARDHLELVGTFDAIEVFALDHEIQIGPAWWGSSAKLCPGLYYEDECEWVRLGVAFDAADRRKYVREMRMKAAELASNAPSDGGAFSQRAVEVFNFLIKE